MKKTFSGIMLSVFAICFAASSAQAHEVKCHLRFNLSSWSIFYKTGSGNGTISCDDGQSVDVRIKTTGGGISFGKSKIVNGRGTFSAVHDIDELFGNYAVSEAHVGASGSAAAQAMWKGDVGLSLSGTGKGWNLGFDFGNFKIARR